MRNSEAAIRLNKCIMNDKMRVPKNFSEMLRSDIYGLLQNFMEITPEDLAIRLVYNSEGKFELKMVVMSDRLRNIPVIV